LLFLFFNLKLEFVRMCMLIIELTLVTTYNAGLATTWLWNICYFLSLNMY
jgi:hypothetical protein